MTSTPALAGQVAIVTGASRGLGRSIALALAAAGAAVTVAARSKADLEETAGLVQHAGGRALAIPTDVTSYTEVERLIDATRSTFGRLDVLVNNSGIAKVQPLVDWRPEDWRTVLDVKWARYNVQVNAIAPGWFATDMSAPAFSPENPKLADRLLRDIPARRTGRPEEIGPLAVYLASSASDFMTGQTIFLDGGHTAA